VLSGEATNTNFIVFGLTQPGLEPTIYRTRGEHTNHYATDGVHQKIDGSFIQNVFYFEHTTQYIAKLFPYGGHGNDPHFAPVAYSKLSLLLISPPCRNSGLVNTDVR
jgi:hypothetical protein